MSRTLVTRLLVETETMLSEILAPADCPTCRTRYHHAQHRLQDVLPGWPTTCVGAGEPGAGGNRGSSSTIAERINLNQEHGYRDLQALRAAPLRCYTHAAALLRSIGLGDYAMCWALPPMAPWRKLLVVQEVTTHLLQRTHLFDRCTVGHARNLYRPMSELYTTVNRWGRNPGQPAPHRTELVANDTTGQLCVNCLRIGHRSHRWRTDLCRWCYDFQLGQGFLPPPEILEARAAGRRITENMVAPHIARHRAKQERKRRKHRR